MRYLTMIFAPLLALGALLAPATAAQAGTLNWQWYGISSGNLPMTEYERHAGIVVFTDDRLPSRGKQAFPEDRAKALQIKTTDGCVYRVDLPARALLSDLARCKPHPFAGAVTVPPPDSGADAPLYIRVERKPFDGSVIYDPG